MKTASFVLVERRINRLSLNYRFRRAGIHTGCTIGAHIRINFINIAFGNSAFRAFINAASTCDAIICNYVSHFLFVFKFILMFYYAKVKQDLQSCVFFTE